MRDDDIYREEIMEHYRNPQNFGVMKHPTYQAEAINPLCGDKILLQLKVDKKGVVTQVRFSGPGCALSVASSSQFTEWMVGKSLKKLKSTGPDQIQKLMRAKIGPARLPCMLLSLVALEKMFIGGGVKSKR
jgi:nitrogen fixation protein NifU and related proteins